VTEDTRERDLCSYSHVSAFYLTGYKFTYVSVSELILTRILIEFIRQVKQLVTFRAHIDF
jgi:hypothetical protein